MMEALQISATERIYRISLSDFSRIYPPPRYWEETAVVDW